MVQYADLVFYFIFKIMTIVFVIFLVYYYFFIMGMNNYNKDFNILSLELFTF